MPTSPHKRCSYPGCASAATVDARCEQHKKPAWSGGRSQQHRVLKGRTLQTARRRMFRDNPLCVLCEAEGRDSVAVIRDHIVPLAEGGQDTDDNVQSVCLSCHQKKSQEEAKRGRKSQ